jgi:hypothetical protein
MRGARVQSVSLFFVTCKFKVESEFLYLLSLLVKCMMSDVCYVPTVLSLIDRAFSEF